MTKEDKDPNQREIVPDDAPQVLKDIMKNNPGIYEGVRGPNDQWYLVRKSDGTYMPIHQPQPASDDVPDFVRQIQREVQNTVDSTPPQQPQGSTGPEVVELGPEQVERLRRGGYPSADQQPGQPGGQKLIPGPQQPDQPNQGPKPGPQKPNGTPGK